MKTIITEAGKSIVALDKNDQGDITLRMNDTEFDMLFPGDRQQQGWESLNGDMFHQLYIPAKEESDCDLCIASGNNSASGSTVYGSREDIIEALLEVGWISTEKSADLEEPVVQEEDKLKLALKLACEAGWKVGWEAEISVWLKKEEQSGRFVATKDIPELYSATARVAVAEYSLKEAKGNLFGAFFAGGGYEHEIYIEKCASVALKSAKEALSYAAQ